MAAERQVDGWLGDAAEFARFYDATLDRIYGYFLSRCGGDVAVAEDLTQESYLAAVRQLQNGTVPDAALPWLFGIARHKLLDHYRRQARTRSELIRWDEDNVDDLPMPPLDPAAEADRERVTLALVRLPASQREVVVLRHLDGLSVPEVAAEVGKSIHAVESLLVRGRAQLKRLLQEAGDDRS